MTDPESVETIDQVIELAERALDIGAHTWGTAGAGQEVTVARNSIALNSLALLPRVGRDVSSIDTATTFLGVGYDMPVGLAPVGALSVYDPGDGAGRRREPNAASGPPNPRRRDSQDDGQYRMPGSR